MFHCLVSCSCLPCFLLRTHVLDLVLMLWPHVLLQGLLLPLDSCLVEHFCFGCCLRGQSTYKAILTSLFQYIPSCQEERTLLWTPSAKISHWQHPRRVPSLPLPQPYGSLSPLRWGGPSSPGLSERCKNMALWSFLGHIEVSQEVVSTLKVISSPFN